jgi:hypothetical protein
MTALQLIKDDLKSARETFEGTVADLTQDMLDNDPGGKAFPIGAVYAHLVFSEDAIMEGMLQKRAPFFTEDWKDKTGADSDMPAMDADWSQNNETWSKNVKIELEQIKKYADAVYKATDEYINSLNDEDLDKDVDLGDWGKRPLSNILCSFIIGHINNLAGEISVLKGLQGKKGYAF